jgi:hypothetical protein
MDWVQKFRKIDSIQADGCLFFVPSLRSFSVFHDANSSKNDKMKSAQTTRKDK